MPTLADWTPINPDLQGGLIKSDATHAYIYSILIYHYIIFQVAERTDSLWRKHFTFTYYRRSDKMFFSWFTELSSCFFQINLRFCSFQISNSQTKPFGFPSWPSNYSRMSGRQPCATIVKFYLISFHSSYLRFYSILFYTKNLFFPWKMRQLGYIWWNFGSERVKECSSIFHTNHHPVNQQLNTWPYFINTAP
jgi:hypothetical protein